MEDTDRRIEQINAENLIWFIYFFIIGLCLYANYQEKQYFLKKDYKAKEKYRKLTIFIFLIAVIIYSYFAIDSYKDVSGLKDSDSVQKKNLNKLSLIGSTLVLMSGLIFLYIAIIDEDLDIELAFN